MTPPVQPGQRVIIRALTPTPAVVTRVQQCRVQGRADWLLSVEWAQPVQTWGGLARRTDVLLSRCEVQP